MPCLFNPLSELLSLQPQLFKIYIQYRLGRFGIAACMQILCFNNKSLACKRRIFYANCWGAAGIPGEQGGRTHLESFSQLVIRSVGSLRVRVLCCLFLTQLFLATGERTERIFACPLWNLFRPKDDFEVHISWSAIWHLNTILSS